MKILNRRAVLRGAGGAAIALPFLDIMRPAREARAQGQIKGIGKNGRPQRLLVTSHQAGQGPGWFSNTMGADGLVLGSVLAPLERFRKNLILIDGIDNKAGAGSGHNAQGTFTTCTGPGGGISFDQAIAKEIAGDTKFKSLQFCIFSGVQSPECLSYSGPGVPLTPASEPQKQLERIFSDIKTDPLVFEKAKARRQSVLDSVKKQYEQFFMKVGRGDKVKLQAHLDGIRDLETRIATLPPANAASNMCSKPVVGTLPSQTLADKRTANDEYLPPAGNVWNDLVVMAFACDLTRVASISWGNHQTNGPFYPWIHPNFQYHGASHGQFWAAPDGPDLTDKNNGSVKAYTWDTGSRWMASYVAAWLDKYKAIEDGPGTLFDNMLFYWCTEVSSGNHTNDRDTNLVAGSAGGYLNTNQRLLLPKGKHGLGDLFTSFLNAFGIPATKFGSAPCNGPLPGVAA